MSKISRATQKLFGSSAGSNQIAEYGSFVAASPATYSGSTITPAIIQTLSNYLTGWFGAVVGSNSPCIEDMNAIHYLFSYQLGYLLQTGVQEWDTNTTYYIGSIANDGTGILYVSLTNANQGNALSSTTNWRTLLGNIITLNPSTQSPYTMTAADQNKTFLVQSSNAAMQFNLPAPSLNFAFTIKDRDGNFATNNCTFHRNASEKIERLAADFIATANFGFWNLNSDGTDWDFV